MGNEAIRRTVIVFGMSASVVCVNMGICINLYRKSLLGLLVFRENKFTADSLGLNPGALLNLQAFRILVL